jgi:TRAP-type C4-dicarboxylate transport system substrate-binding protein
MKTRNLIGAAALAAASVTGAQAQEVTLALSHWVPPVHPLQATGMEMWAESVAEASEGRIAVEIYPAQQLGAAADHYDMARDGIVDIGFINPGYQPGRFPIIAAAELPFTISNAIGGSRALHEWYLDYAGQEMSDVKVCMVHLHDPGTLHGVSGPLQAPEDFDGLNIRPAHGTLARLVNLLGAASVQVPAPAMRDLINSGGADVTASPWGSLFVFGVQDAVTHHLDMPFYVTTFAFVMNQGTYDGLSPENRAVIDDHCNPEWSQRITTGWVEAEASGYQRLKDAGGHEFYVPTDEEVERWRAVAAPLIDEWKASAAEAGIDADAAYDDLIAKLREHDALYD